MSAEIKEHDDSGNLVYYKNSIGEEHWMSYNKSNKLTACITTDPWSCDYWKEYDEKNRIIRWWNSGNMHMWYKYNRRGKPVSITKEEFEVINKIQITRFELMDI